MYRFELAAPHRTAEAATLLYFATGRQIFDAVQGVVAWRFGGFGAVRSLFDFASGYGRSTRFLVEALPPGKITVAEIDPGAVRFPAGDVRRARRRGGRGAGIPRSRGDVRRRRGVVVLQPPAGRAVRGVDGPAVRARRAGRRADLQRARHGAAAGGGAGAAVRDRLPPGQRDRAPGRLRVRDLVRDAGVRTRRDGPGGRERRAPRGPAARAVRFSGPVRALPSAGAGGAGSAPGARPARRSRARRSRERGRHGEGLGRRRPRRAAAGRAASAGPTRRGGLGGRGGGGRAPRLGLHVPRGRHGPGRARAHRGGERAGRGEDPRRGDSAARTCPDCDSIRSDVRPDPSGPGPASRRGPRASVVRDARARPAATCARRSPSR